MRRERRNIAFSLSFLDIMACGFGAVTLLFIILRYNIDEVVDPNIAANAEIERLNEDLYLAETQRADIRNDLNKIQRELDEAIEESDEYKIQKDQSDKDQSSRDEAYQRYQEEIRELQEQLTELEEGQAQELFYGQNLMTGFDFSGKNILLMVDGSNSMLSDTVQEGIQLRGALRSGRATIEDAIKWQWVVKSVTWLVANIIDNRKFQVYIFNTETIAAIPDTADQWLVADQDIREDVINGIRQHVPSSGTSLANAMASIKEMKPKPDHIFLLTDGLPTQGKSEPRKYMVTPRERRRHFLDAVAEIPRDIKVSTILYPLDGDAEAALLYWKLAYDRGGSYITPSRDWP